MIASFLARGEPRGIPGAPMKRPSLDNIRGRGGRTYGISMSRFSGYFCAGTVVIGLAAIDADNNILLILFGICLGAILLSFFSGWRSLRRVSVMRVAPEMSVAGQSLELRYTITNHRTWAGIRSLRITESVASDVFASVPAVFIPRLKAQEALTVAVPTVAMRRGRVTLRAIKVSTGYPFELVKKVITHRVEDEVVIYPCLGRIHGELTKGREIRDLASVGASLVRSRGDDEFFGIREYRQGDNPRRIHWRRSAASGQLMIREMARTRDPQLWCIIDTLVDPQELGSAYRLELIISAAATLICDALERGLRVGLISNGDPLLVLPPGGGRRRRTRLLRELALRGVNTSDRLLDQVQRITWPTRWRGGGILFTTHQSGDVDDVARLLSRTIGPTRAYVPQTPSFDSLFDPPTILESEDAWRSIG